MRPIEHRTDLTFNQALKCVSYRLPMRSGLKSPAVELSLGLRYGLMGAAAAHHLLLSCPDQDEQSLLGHLFCYGELVSDHVREQVKDGYYAFSDKGLPGRIGELAREPLMSYLPLYKRLCPLELCLSVACDEFALAHQAQILSGWNLLTRRRARREFQAISDQSYGYALCFFERRQVDLDEVPEIALLGE